MSSQEPPGPSDGRTREASTLAVPTDASEAELVAGHIGAYRIVRVIGEGGMGVVYEGEQTEPLRRSVALKVIKAGMDTREVVARFMAERQALATMDHPGIAKVFEAGATEGGQPYFVMEFVPGLPITEHCDRHQLGTHARLELFVHVCQAIQHAHQKGIIHRDIKPSNVLVELVDGEAAPKVIDFGVAKATAQGPGERTLFTERGQIIGTPEYMSPEQAEGLTVDTRCDIYSLGALLYELLAGAMPFDSEVFWEAGFAGVQRILREQEPLKPSARFLSLGAGTERVAANRGTGRASLAGELRGDLDWITMKAMEKDPARRYAAASELAADIGRHLGHEPVLAGPPGTGYRVAKFVRRNRVLVTGLSGMFVALVAGIAGTSWQAVRATRAEEQASEQAAIATAVADFLAGMLAEASPENNPRGREFTVREVLDEASADIESAFGDQPDVRAAVRSTIGETYLALGHFDDAEKHVRAALQTRIEHVGPSHPDVAESMHELGKILWAKSEYAAAEARIRSALDLYRRAYGDEHETALACLNDLAVVLQSRGDYEGAEPLLREVLAIRSRGAGEPDSEYADSLTNLAWVLRFKGDLDGAEPLFRDALSAYREQLGADHPSTLSAMTNLAAILHLQGDRARAGELYHESLGIMRSVLGPEHPTTLRTVRVLGELHLAQGNADAAEPLLSAGLAAAEQSLGRDHALTVTFLADMGWLHRVREDPAAAEPYYRETMARRMRALGEEHPHTIRAQWQVSRVLVDQEKFAGAERIAVDAVRAGRRVLPEDHEDLSSALLYHGLALLGQGRAVDAEPCLRECLEARRRTLGEGRWEVAHARSALGESLARQGRLEEAQPLLVGGYEALRADPATPPRRVREARARVAELQRSREGTGAGGRPATPD